MGPGSLSVPVRQGQNWFDKSLRSCSPGGYIKANSQSHIQLARALLGGLQLCCILSSSGKMKVNVGLLCLSAVSVVCWAQPLLRYGADTNDRVLTGCDDCHTGARRLLYGDIEFMGEEQQYYAVSER